jgi:hypothetical protein
MMIYTLFLMLLVTALLIYGSWYDLQHHMVEHWLWITIVVLGLINLVFFSASQVESLAVVFFMATVWGLPCFFAFGLGDFALIMGMSMFIPNVDSMWIYIGIVITIWIAYTVILFLQKKIVLNKNAFFYHEYAFVPVLTLSFMIWSLVEVVV